MYYTILYELACVAGGERGRRTGGLQVRDKRGGERLLREKTRIVGWRWSGARREVRFNMDIYSGLTL